MQKTIVITGASDGIGTAAARELSRQGHQVVIVGRSEAKTTAIAQELGAAYFVTDFSQLSQVRELAAQLLVNYPRIDVLANNAGGFMGERAITNDGFEKAFQVNHLAPFLLTNLLMPVLIGSGATVIQTASLAARLMAKFDIEDLQSENSYSAQAAYGNAKLANILFTSELQRRFGGEGINAAAFHPGIVGTSFASDTAGFMKFIYHGPFKRFFTVDADKGANQLIWLAEATPGLQFETGAYYESGKIASKVNPLIHDEALAKQLWDRSATLVGI